MKKKEWEKELCDVLYKKYDMCLSGVEVTGYSQDGSMAYIDVKVRLAVNGEISDLPNGYQKGTPESEYIMSILESKKKMTWKEYDKVCDKLAKKGYDVSSKVYYKGKRLTKNTRWKVAPNKFTFEIVRVDKFD